MIPVPGSVPAPPREAHTVRRPASYSVLQVKAHVGGNIVIFSLISCTHPLRGHLTKTHRNLSLSPTFALPVKKKNWWWQTLVGKMLYSFELITAACRLAWLLHVLLEPQLDADATWPSTITCCSHAAVMLNPCYVWTKSLTCSQCRRPTLPVLTKMSVAARAHTPAQVPLRAAAAAAPSQPPTETTTALSVDVSHPRPPFPHSLPSSG